MINGALAEKASECCAKRITEDLLSAHNVKSLLKSPLSVARMAVRDVLANE